MHKSLTVTGSVAAIGGFSALWYNFAMPQLGAAAAGERLERLRASPNFVEGRAQNPVPTELGMSRDMASVGTEYLRSDVAREPEVPIPVVRPDVAALSPTGADLRVTWLGHSTTLLEVDGHLLLTDPVFSERASPVSWSGPKRFHPVPLTVSELPPLDAVLISHDHYDHLDHASILALNERGLRFVVPLGVGAHLESWGVSPERITELDWWQEARVGDLRVVATPARHFSGRGIFDRNRTLWTSYAVVGPQHRAWFSGDTGPFEAATEIGERLGPFDLTLIEVCAYHPAWGNVHLGPDAAAELHLQVRGKVMMPVHWGTFKLALHAWDQPVVRLQERAEELGIALLAPVPGQLVSAASPVVAGFWQDRR